MIERDLADLERHGFAVVPGLLDRGELSRLSALVDSLPRSASERGGVRGLLAKSRSLAELARNGPPSELAKQVLGRSAKPVKATLFDKSEQANWSVPLHQDLTIAVEKQVDVDGFGPWSVKDGVVHARPPAEILERMVAIRLHLDDTGPDNGALGVVPGSHRHGRLSGQEATDLRRDVGKVICSVGAGGAMLMFPLLLHSSSKSSRPGPRRVVHIEYAATKLPGGLTWVGPNES